MKLIHFIRSLKKDGIEVKIIRCDNAGANKDFENEAAKQPGLNLTFEYTAPSTPQQNGRVKRKFLKLYSCMRAMNHGSNLPVPTPKQLWTECANTATDLDGILEREGQKLSTFQKFSGKDKNYIVNGSKKF